MKGADNAFPDIEHCRVLVRLQSMQLRTFVPALCKGVLMGAAGMPWAQQSPHPLAASSLGIDC